MAKNSDITKLIAEALLRKHAEKALLELNLRGALWRL